MNSFLQKKNFETNKRLKNGGNNSAPVYRPFISGHTGYGNTSIQRKPACPCGGGCPRCQDNLSYRTGLSVQKSTGNPADPGAVPSVVYDVLVSHGEPLDHDARTLMELRFGHNFSKVRVHTDGQAGGSAAAVHSRAYTVGNHIVFGAGRYRPGSSEGRRLLMHELTHVVQQAGGVSSPGGLQIGPAEGTMEAEASDAEAARPGFKVHAAAAPNVIQREVLPVAKFSPAPGLFVDRTEKSISISGRMELYGPEANSARAASIQNSINTNWTQTFSDGFSVSCNITVTYRGPGSKAGAATQIEADNISGPSHVSPGFGGRSMVLNAGELDAFTWTPAHEFGHIIGLKDRYSEGIISKIKGKFGGQRTATVQPGYEGNLMAESGGKLESKNVKDVAEENEPSPYWINDDDQVRDWVNGHPVGDIGKLSTANKLRAIRTLMGGWISDDDVAAIGRICSSVTSKTEADTIRSGVDLLSMTSIGQRTMVRVIFSRMP